MIPVVFFLISIIFWGVDTTVQFYLGHPFGQQRPCIHSIVVRCNKSPDAPITTKDNTLLNLFWWGVCVLHRFWHPTSQKEDILSSLCSRHSASCTTKEAAHSNQRRFGYIRSLKYPLFVMLTSLFVMFSNMTLVTCGWPSCASLIKQKANQKRGSWILIRQDKSICFQQSSCEKSCKIQYIDIEMVFGTTDVYS